MKKRVFMLAMALGLLLSMCASAGATSYMLSNTVGGYTIKYNVSDAGSTFKIPVQAQVAIASRSNLTGYVEDVDSVKIGYIVSPSASFEGVKITQNKDGTGATADSTTISITDTTPDTYPYNAYLIGTAKGNGTITVKSTLMKGSDVKQESDTTATITFSTSQGEDVVDSNFMSDGPNEDVPTVRPSSVDNTPGDPAASNIWDGKDPPFGKANKEGDTYKGNGKDKPTIATIKLVFQNTGGSSVKYATADKALKSGVSGDFKIEIKGPNPYVNVYISGKDAKKIWPLSCDKKLTGEAKDWEEDIPLTKENIIKWKIPFRVTSYDIKTDASQDKGTKHYLTIAYNGAEVAYKDFPITISAANDKTNTKNGQKPVSKQYKLNVVSSRQVPQWVTALGVVGERLAKKNAQEISVALASGGTLGGVIYTVSADGPYYITSKGDKFGMSADVTQPVLNRFGEVTTPGFVKLHGKFTSKDTKVYTKETKVSFTLDAVGNVKKTTFKPTVIGKVSPYFSEKDFVTSNDKSYAGLPNTFDDGTYYKAKTAEAGKVPSVKFSAKGSKTITYSITPEKEAELATFGLSFDSKKGQVVQLTNGGNKVPTKATSHDGEYAPVEITVTADNGTGHTNSAKALVGVTGEKAKVFLGTGSDNKEIKNLVIPQDATAGTLFTIGAKVGRATTMATSGDKTVNFQYRLADAKNAKEGKEDLGVGEDTYKLQGLGLVFIPSDEFGTQSNIGETPFKDYYRNLGVIKVNDELTATKGTKVNLIVSNLGNEQKGSLNIVIQDPKPVIAHESGLDSIDIYIHSADKDPTVERLYLSVGAPTNTAKINWKFASEGDNKGELKTKKLNAVKEKVGTKDVTIQGEIDLTLQAKADAKSVTNVMTITAENAESKLKSDSFTVRVHINQEKPSSGGDNVNKPTQSASRKGSAAPADNTYEPVAEEPVKDDSEDENNAEEAVVFGAPRTVAQLTAGQTAFLAEKGYKVVAVLPEVTAKVDGQQEFEVELDEDAPEGAKLIWLPFPKNAEETDDDTIADFYDAEGSDIEEVPAGKVIVVAPWLRAGVTYQPVIAVEE